jgi:hypothetical protein
MFKSIYVATASELREFVAEGLLIGVLLVPVLKVCRQLLMVYQTTSTLTQLPLQ